MKRHRLLRSFLFAAIVVSTIGCDQAVKEVARTQLAGAPLSFLGGCIRLSLALNQGGFLGLGSSFPAGLRAAVFVTGVATVLFLGAVFLARNRFDGHLSTLIFAWFAWAGGLSNLIDRVRFGGRVTDFMVLGVGPLHTGIFNVADVAITFGGIFIVLSVFWRESRAPIDGGQ